jgi:signal transduction histidine kinase
MRATVPLPDLLRPLRRYRVELLWAVVVAASFLAMLAWPTWETIPFYVVWISLTLVYGLRRWPVGPTLVVMLGVMALTAVPIAFDVVRGIQPWERLVRVPLVATLFLAMVWQARRRVEALKIAEGQAEERRSMLESQERFIHDASHELRTPVTIARGHLELLLGRRGDHPELDVALDELSRIDAIIGRLLLLASADQPDFVQLTEVDLEPFLEDLFMRWSEVAPRTWRVGRLVPGRLWVDPDRLRAAIDALFENAVKFTRERDAIELRALADGPGRVRIEVDDEGSGVQQEALERIFDRFARADAARTRSAGGVGLGLAIVDAIAKSHGGGCTVLSTDRGSTFALQLPGFVPAGSPEHPGSPQPAAAPQPVRALSSAGS